MFWWIFGFTLLLMLAPKLWRIYRHPVHQLGIEAANLGWRISGYVKDPSGFRCTRMIRDGKEAIILYKEQMVRLTKPPVDRMFKSYRELDSWLHEQQVDASNEPEQLNSGYLISEDRNNFHPALDKVNELIVQFSEDGTDPASEAAPNSVATNPNIELISYAITRIAMRRSAKKISPASWNGFKRAIENRMLAIQEDGSQRDKSFKAKEGRIFAHFTSSYWADMDQIDTLVDQYLYSSESKKSELSSHLFRKMGWHEDLERLFESNFSALTDYAQESIFPKVRRTFL